MKACAPCRGSQAGHTVRGGLRAGRREAASERGVHADPKLRAKEKNRAGVGHEFVDAVGERQSWRPEVVVGIDDRAGRIDRLFRVGVEPVRGHRNRHGGHGRTPTGDALGKPDVSHITHVRPLSRREAPIGCPV